MSKVTRSQIRAYVSLSKGESWGTGHDQLFEKEAPDRSAVGAKTASGPSCLADAQVKSFCGQQVFSKVQSRRVDGGRRQRMNKSGGPTGRLRLAGTDRYMVTAFCRDG